MEQLNSIELRGTVGSVYVKDFGNTKCANFSMATNYAFKDRDGCPVIETTWHRVIAWQEQCPDMDIIQKGAQLHVQGRLRMRRYVDADGNDRDYVEVFANKVEAI
jgi:single-strand DNA-binding protein